MTGSYGPPDRFNEEQATYTVRGADTPDLETGVAAIRNVLKTLPDQFEVTIPRLRSLDNAEVSMNVMVFMQLVDVQKL